MPVHNFMVEDLLGSLRAICLFPLFVFVPGYVAAWLFDVFDFRRRTAVFRMALSVPLSIALCPIVTYLAGRFGSMSAVWGIYAAAGVGFLAVLAIGLRKGIPRRMGVPAGSLVFAGVVAVWLAVALFSLVDIQLGDRLYYPTSALDYSVRTAFVHSISTTGVPPQNPFFLPGHPVPLRYHYFWPMMCSLVNQAGGAGVSPRQALIGGTFWCGVGLMALVALYLRIFAVNRPALFRRRALTGILLLGITGLDILPSLFFLFLYARGMLGIVLPSAEWWNEHVDWFVYTALWAPHALAALLACFTGFLLLWHAPASGRSGIPRYGLLGGIALASSVGASIWVSFVFAAFLTVWTAVTVWKKWYRETAALAVAGLTCAALALPYLRDLQGPGAGGPLLDFTVRAFSLAAMIPSWHGMSQWWRLILVNAPLLPLNYLLEFGFFFLVARLKWRQFRTSGRPLSRQDLACVTMLATSTLICTFLRSSVIGCNDLGWRGFLVAQFVLLLWSVDIFAGRERGRFLSLGQRELLAVFMALGVAGTVYDLSMVRLYPLLADRGLVPPLDWMAPDRNFGKRTYASRDAYQWVHGATPPTAAIQFNPKVVFQDTVAMIYSDRQTVAADLSCITTFGGDPKLCPPIVSRVQEIFPASGQPAPPSIQKVCEALPIDLVVAKDTDPVWADRGSWVWTEKPAFANHYMRLFRCPPRRPVSPLEPHPNQGAISLVVPHLH